MILVKYLFQDRRRDDADESNSARVLVGCKPIRTGPEGVGHKGGTFLKGWTRGRRTQGRYFLKRVDTRANHMNHGSFLMF